MKLKAMQVIKNLGIVSALGLLLTQVSEGVIFIDITEDGGNLEIQIQGSLNTAALGSDSGIVGGTDPAYTANEIITGPGFADQGLLFFATPSSGSFILPTGTFTVDSSSGTTFADYFELNIGVQTLVIGNTLQAGGSIDATLTDVGGSLALGGFTDGDSSTATFTSGVFSDSITFRVGSAAPEPSSAFLLGFGAFAMFARRKRAS